MAKGAERVAVFPARVNGWGGTYVAERGAQRVSLSALSVVIVEVVSSYRRLTA